MSNTKYQLPGSTNMYVDLVDDEDVKLMFDEWADYLEAEGKNARTAKLHIYIDYQSSSKRTTAHTGDCSCSAVKSCICDIPMLPSIMTGSASMCNCVSLLLGVLESRHWI